MNLLCVIAHPDDECFAFGGALTLAADAGHTVRVVCATDGQSGSYRGTAKDDAELAEMRRAEFLASCAVLGVQQPVLLGYVDGQLVHASFDQLTSRLVGQMRAFQPQIVLTFGLDGSLNTHPDHTVIAAATTCAFGWAASEKRLPDQGLAHRADRLFHQSTDFFLPDRPAPLPSPWSVKLDVSTVLSRKQRAFAAHVTQAPLMEKTRSVFEEHGNFEFYALAAASRPQPAEIRTSLWENL